MVLYSHICSSSLFGSVGKILWCESLKTGSWIHWHMRSSLRIWSIFICNMIYKFAFFCMTNFIIISSCDVTQQRESPSAVIVPFILCLLFGLPLKLWDKCLKKWCNSLSKALEAWTKQWREYATCNLCTRESWRRHSVIVFCFLSRITVVIKLKCRTRAYEVFSTLCSFWRY